MASSSACCHSVTRHRTMRGIAPTFTAQLLRAAKLRPEVSHACLLSGLPSNGFSSSTGSDHVEAIKSLRLQTGAPMADVRAALSAASWDQGTLHNQCFHESLKPYLYHVRGVDN